MKLADIWIGTVIAAVVNMSEPLRTAVKNTVVELDRKAKTTPNPWDNILVSFLAGLLGVELEEPDAKTGASSKFTPGDPRNIAAIPGDKSERT